MPYEDSQHANVLVNFHIVSKDGTAEEGALRFLRILDRRIAGDETSSDPKRFGGDDGVVYIDHWIALEPFENNDDEDVEVIMNIEFDLLWQLFKRCREFSYPPGQDRNDQVFFWLSEQVETEKELKAREEAR